jgi:hypothetical protein
MQAHGWRIEGTYFESCNCDAICPCRRIDGAAGGRSTHGVCLGVLSWLIERGRADALDLSGLAVAIASRYSDDEPGSPWQFLLYLDERGSADQREALEEIFLGHRGGSVLEHFPWAWKPSDLLDVRPVRIDLVHEPFRQRLRIRDRVSVRIREAYDGGEHVGCVIPGYARPGAELLADELRVDDGPLRFAYHGTCGYQSTFDYASA